ncbi:head GIN domain-containing protein [Phnomibacter sp. MR]|uniref:head GIN domain-containing protein n=1 Tax=Phnomibacter sp. MR TaxID=3042318 RepID=UPI003A7F7E1E
MKKMHLLLLTVLTLSTGVALAQWKRISGNGNVVTQTRETGEFSEIVVSGSMQVEVAAAPGIGVQVQAEDNLQEYIITEVKGNRLQVKFKSNVSVNSHKAIKVLVRMPKLNAASIAGSGSIRSSNQLNSNGNFAATISGSGSVDVQTSASKVAATIAGSGNIALAGKTDDLHVVISGSGSFKGYQLSANEASVQISGSGDVQAYASNKLDAAISGSGSVYYKGNASISVKTSGSGKVRKAD